MQNKNVVKLFLAGDVMTGRGIDQILPTRGNPRIYEQWVRDAGEYVLMAERVSGEISRDVDFSYIWGDALREFEIHGPDARIINLETSITTHNKPWPYKGINYRMHPDATAIFTEAGIDCCTLANNHVVDWGYEGLAETVQSLYHAGIAVAGAGKNLSEAVEPAVITLDGSRILVFAWGLESSGVFSEWAATENKPGIAYLSDLSDESVEYVKGITERFKKDGDIVVASIHWGENWDYEISPQECRFAHGLIDKAGIDLFFGHSSHHVKSTEIYNGHLILYGCGDLINDYEGLRGYHEFRGDLSLIYFVSVEISTGSVKEVEMVPVTMNRFRVKRLYGAEVASLKAILDREGKKFGTWVEITEKDTLILRTS